MIRDPLILILWAPFPAVAVLALSYLPNRFALSTPLSEKQPWGCRAVAVALVFMGAHFRELLDSSDRAASLVGRWPWTFEGLLLALLAVQTLPTLLLLRRYDPPHLPRIGLARNRTHFLATATAAGYFLMVFLYSVVRSYTTEGWNGLYAGQVWTEFYRFPLSHGLALIIYTVVAAGAEEIVFRGFALIPIARMIGPAGGITATALFWSMGHFNVTRLLGLFLLGLLLGWLFYRTGSLVPSLTLHILMNLGASSDFLFGRLRAAGVHWTNQQHFLFIGVGSLCLAFVLALTAYGQRRRGVAGNAMAQEGSLGRSNTEAKSKRPRLRRRR